MTEENIDIKAEGPRSVAGERFNAPVLTGNVAGNVYIGTSPKDESGEKHALDLPNKFFQICDRTPQVQDFDDGVELHIRSNRSRPIIVLVHGPAEEEHDLIIDRLRLERLPPLLKKVHDTAVQPMTWHEPPKPQTRAEDYWKSISRHDPFVSQDSDISDNHQKKILSIIPQITSHNHLLVQMSYYESDFVQGNTQSLLAALDPRRYLGNERLITTQVINWLENLISFWSQWPQTGSGQMVICLASLTYKNSAWRSKGARDSDWLLEWGKSYQERTGQSSPSVVVLSRLKPITDGDAKRWCKKLHETVKDSKTLEHVSNRVSEIYQDKPDLTLPMRDLIKEVKKTCSSY